ncbi:Os05g0141901 [Oryza sativa Japonica Group]|uniref:Os05g0141901 protein n=1 Tax=Oryza sativa subsp. japonica TaxID=39947 RepID=A0A0P0WHR4_ORYSJ|nr:Os05g0141901 [Oryza sativa Japonica Group]
MAPEAPAKTGLGLHPPSRHLPIESCAPLLQPPSILRRAWAPLHRRPPPANLHAASHSLHRTVVRPSPSPTAGLCRSVTHACHKPSAYVARARRKPLASVAVSSGL